MSERQEEDDGALDYYEREFGSGEFGKRARFLFTQCIDRWEREGANRAKRLRYQSSHSSHSSDDEASETDAAESDVVESDAAESGDETSAADVSEANYAQMLTALQRAPSASPAHSADSACVLCLENERVVVLFPCKHRTFCKKCAQSTLRTLIEKQNDLGQLANCATCRRRFSRMDFIFP